MIKKILSFFNIFTCKTCKYWTRYGDQCNGDCVKILEHPEKELHESIFHFKLEDERYPIKLCSFTRTGINFGCIHWRKQND